MELVIIIRIRYLFFSFLFFLFFIKKKNKTQTMNPTTTTTTTTISNSSSFPSWHDHQHHLGYPNNDDSCFDFMIPTQESSSTDPRSGTASYNGLVGNARTSSPCMFAEGAPPVFSDYPISIPATWCPPCYSAAPTAVSTHHHHHHHHHQQQQQQQGFYDESSLSSSSISTMPPTPPDDLIPVSISFAADPALSHPYYPHYSTIPVNKVTPDNNSNHRDNKDHSLQSGCGHTKNHSGRTTSTIGKHRKTRRSSDKPKEKKKCSNCGSTKTPTWRRGPITKALLCNACGL